MRIVRRDGQAADLVFGLSGLAAVFLTAAIVMLLDRASAEPVCFWHRLTGLPCPTCGTTRALRALFDGHIADAFRLQPLAMGAGALLLGLSAFDAFGVIVFRRVVRVALSTRERRLLFGLALAAVLLNWIYLVRTLS